VIKNNNDPKANKILHEIMVIKGAKKKNYCRLIVEFDNKIEMT
jgi:hypothetical protein